MQKLDGVGEKEDLKGGEYFISQNLSTLTSTLIKTCLTLFLDISSLNSLFKINKSFYFTNNEKLSCTWVYAKSVRTVPFIAHEYARRLIHSHPLTNRGYSKLCKICEKFPEISLVDSLNQVKYFASENGYFGDGMCTARVKTSFAVIQQMAGLQSLEMWKTTIQDEELKFVELHSALTHLNLTGCTHITDKGVYYLSALTSLTTLNFEGCYRVTDTGMGFLSGLSLLSNLSLKDCYLINDAALSHVSRLPSLLRLNLESCDAITDAGLASLSRLSLLTDLNLENCHKLKGSGLHFLSRLPALSVLNLSECVMITDAALGHLSSLSSLTDLSLEGCYQITDEGIGHLKSLTLSRMTLVGCAQVTPASLRLFDTSFSLRVPSRSRQISYALIAIFRKCVQRCLP